MAATASALAIGTGVVIDRLVLPQFRSENTSASGAERSPSVEVPAGPQSDPLAATGKGSGSGSGSGSGTGAGGGRTSASPAPAAEEQTPPLKAIHPPKKSTSAKPSTPKRSAAPDAPSTPGGSTTPGGGSGGSGGSSGPEASVVSLTNAERAKHGCPALRNDARLATAARKHSADMAANNYFDHTSRNGDSPWKRMEDAGYSSPGAENIAKGYPTASAVVKGWMDSPGHRANILNCGLRAIGVGMASGSGGPLWTQDFGWK
ncbi:CAP domain-containing protein [Actinomadura luteofluorescens]|uniref:CAP domain-containing protein n=1 Tax=Actinomadura luteofluorescens TaxID=46163 RepID=UPI003D926B18